MTALTDRVDGLFAEWDRPDSPGCALGIVQDGRLVYKRGYGMANLEHAIPISSRTVFRIGSTSKQFTAACIALLAEQGKLSLDDDIRKYLPEMPEYERPITIRHLIHHTSGLRDYLTLMDLAGVRDDDYYTDEEVIAMLARQKALNFAPGDEYLYSNSGYFLLAAIVKRVSRQSLREFAEEQILNPLGMENTHFHDDHTMVVKHRAAGYSPREEGGYRIDMTTLDVVGDGGVFTTVEDLFLWDQNFYEDRLGGKGLIARLLTPGRLNSGEPLDYAFGLMVSDYKGVPTISHGGTFVGFRAEMIRFPEQSLSVICLANLSSINPSRLARQVADIYLADAFDAEEEAAETRFIKLVEGALEDKSGVHWSADSGMVVALCLQDGQLRAEVFGECIRLAPVSATDFVSADALFDVTFKFDRQGQGEPWLAHVRVDDGKPEALQAVEVVAPTADQLAAYEGAYDSDELRVTYRFVLQDGELFLRHRNAPRDPLKPLLDDVFRVGRLAIHFARDGQGRVSGFTVQAGRVRNIRFVRREAG